MNKKLYIFGISETPLCSFCHTKEETTFRIFFGCCKIQSLWEELKKYFHDDFSLPILLSQGFLGLWVGRGWEKILFLISNQLRYFIFVDLFMYVILIFSFGVIAFTNCNCISVYLYLYFCCLFERKKIETKKKRFVVFLNVMALQFCE